MLTVTMSNKEALEALFAVVLPAIVSWLKDAQWSHQAKALLSFVVAGIAGALTVIVDGKIVAADWITTALTIWIASQAVYSVWFKATATNSWLESKHVL